MKPRPLYVLKLSICMLLLLAVSSQIYSPERNNTANSLFDQQDYAGALDAYQLAQVNAPDEWAYYYNAASALTETGRLRAAIDALEQALVTDDEALKTEAYYNLGHVYYQLGRYDDAVTAFREVLRHTPDDEDARHNYELALERQLPTPTPTLQEQQTDPEEDETNPEITPTRNPADQDPLTPTVTPTSTPTSTITSTPTPTSPPDDSEQSSPDGISTPVTNDTGPTGGTQDDATDPLSNSPLTLEDVERQFDAIQDSQQTLRQALETVATPERPNDKDW